MKRIYLIMLMIAAAMMMSCNPKDDDDNDGNNNTGAEKATVVTKEVTDVTSSSAKVVCSVTDDGGAEVSSRGVCWDTSDNPIIATALSMGAGSGIGNYECELDGLESNTTYYVRAYATNSAGISYGEVKNFTTKNGDGGNDDGTGVINGHGYVDLGLPSGKKWATCNVGATSAEDYGDYFAWGETSPKAEYEWDNSVTYGEQMGDISGNAQYDAATANWGGSWRMPTREECLELVDHCEWEWTQVNGVNGAKVIGPNGSCIFLPAAGSRYGASLYNDGYYGYYWSSTPYDSSFDYFAYDLHFDNGGEDVDGSGRDLGQTVRPISE